MLRHAVLRRLGINERPSDLLTPVKKRNLEEVFAAAYLCYARYVNPIRGERCDIHDTISLLAEQRRQNERNRAFHACVGFRWWKRPYAKAYLQSTGGEVEFFQDRKRAVLSAWAKGGEIVVWSSNVDEALQKECDDTGVTLARMEDGFIRSVGLGSDFNWPYSLVVDRKGIYYDPPGPANWKIFATPCRNIPTIPRCWIVPPPCAP